MKIPFFNYQQKSSVVDIDISDPGSVGLLLGISDEQPINVLPRRAYYLNERNSDLGTATSRIAGSISSLKKGLANEEGEITYTHPFLSLLNKPGYGVNAGQFWRELAESFLLTQEAWVIGRGNVKRPPLSLLFMRPYDVHVVMDETDGIPQFIETQSSKDRRRYYRVEEQGGTVIRFIDKAGLNEIFPIIGALSLVDDWRGRSPLIKLFYDLSMNTDGKRHNVSLLKNGMRVSSVISPAPASKDGAPIKWNEKIVKTLQDALRSFNQGAGNAGNNVIISSPAKVEGLAQNNRDMDFLNLLKTSQIAIYNLYEIPLALVLPDTMTLDNYTTAIRVYYTKAVFPVFDDLGAGLIESIGRRFNINSDTTTLGFSEVAIRDMQQILVENMEKLKQTEAVLINEIRKVGGLKDTPGGDVLLVSSNKIPLAFVAEPIDFTEPGTPPEEPPGKTEDVNADGMGENEDDTGSTEE